MDAIWMLMYGDFALSEIQLESLLAQLLVPKTLALQTERPCHVHDINDVKMPLPWPCGLNRRSLGADVFGSTSVQFKNSAAKCKQIITDYRSTQSHMTTKNFLKVTNDYRKR